MCINVSEQLTVYFEDPFWVGVFEFVSNNKISSSKKVFGAEPKDYEVYEFILKHYYDVKYSNPMNLSSGMEPRKKINHKRLQKLIKKQVSEKGIGTRSQQVLKLQYEECKEQYKKVRKQREEILADLKFQKKQEKKKMKKRGH